MQTNQQQAHMQHLLPSIPRFPLKLHTQLLSPRVPSAHRRAWVKHARWAPKPNASRKPIPSTLLYRHPT